MSKRLIVSFMLLLISTVVIIPAAAQTELLQNGNFEELRYNFVSSSPDGTQFNTPIAWAGTAIVQSGGPSWQNIQPNGFPHFGSFVYSGRRSYNISRGYATFTAYIYQTVVVVPGTEVRGGAYAYMQSHRSAVARVGIDPMGGTDPFASTVVWTESGGRNRWLHLEVTTQAQSELVTLFLFATQREPNNPNDIYWDAAYLIGTPGTTSPSAANNAPAPAPQKIAEATVNLNVRSGAGVQFARIGGIGPGETYPVIAQDDSGWVQISYGGGVGYVLGRYVEIRDGVPTTAASTDGAASTTTAAASPPAAESLPFLIDYQLNLRTTPSTSGEILLQIPWEAVVSAIGRTSDNVWLQVQYNGQTGWIAARYGRFQRGRMSDLRVVQ